MNRKLVIPLLAMFAIAIVAAGVYVVNTINLTVDVKEPFTVQYAILGDAGNYNGELCSWGNVTYYPLDNDGVFDKDGFYPMESRKICIKIKNVGQADVPYTVTSTVTNDNLAGDCIKAFGNHSLTGIATALADTITGEVVTISADAPIVNNCNVQIKVGRGTI